MQFYEQTFNRYQNFIADPKKKNYFDIAASLFLLIILVIMIYPAIQHIVKVNKEIQDGKVISGKLDDKINNLKLAEDNLNEIKSDLGLVEKALPVGSDLKTYLQNPIEKLAKSHQLNLDSIQFSDVPISLPSKDALLNSRDINFTLSLTGNFINIQDFIKDLENYIRITSVRQIDIKEKGNTESVTLQATTNYLGTPITIVPNQTGGGTSK